MPAFDTRIPPFKPVQKSKLKWEGWGNGWNEYFDDTELKPDELADATNLMLKGKGTITGRWGSTESHLAGSGRVRLLDSYIDVPSNTNELLTITDDGYLAKQSGASYATITGASWASGYSMDSTQMGGNVYIVGGDKELAKYDGTTLSGYPTLAKPTGVTATNLSGVSGTWTYGWRISAFSNVGETLATDSVQLVNMPQDLTKTLTKVAWTGVSAASGVLQGYGIYRGRPGGETYIASVDENTTTFLDEGLSQSDTIFPQNADTTGGPKAQFILPLDDRLVISGFEDDPSLVMISARYPYESRYHWADGGGYVRISPDDGDKITGLSIVGSNVKGGTTPSTILVFKEKSTYAMVLKTVTIGNYVLLDPQFQKLMPIGAMSNAGIAEVENDVFFASRDGIYSVGSEPNYLNEIRSKETSTRIRPYVRGLSDADLRESCSAYIDHKYLLSFPARKETIVYDYEQRAFMGPWKTPFGITTWFKYFDGNGTERWLVGCTDGYVRQFSPSLLNDSGTAFKRLAVTRKEDFGDWTIMKILELFYILMRNVKGNVNVTVRGEDRSGKTIGLKTFTISGGSSGAAGYGTTQYGISEYGLSNNDVSITSEDFIRYSQIYKTIRVVQVEVSSTEAAANFDLINIRMEAQPLGIGSLSPTTRA